MSSWSEEDERMSALVAAAEARGISLWIDGEHVRFRCAASAIPSELLQALKSKKKEIYRVLKFCRRLQPDTMPMFRRRPDLLRVRSFRRVTWEGLKSGKIASDAANGLHVVMRIVGSLDIEAMQQALLSVGERHHVLGACVLDIDGQPWLSYEGRRSIAMERFDLTSRSEGERDAAALEIATDQVWRPFELSRGPLARSFIVTFSRTEHVWGFVLHHFVGDELSRTILLQEVSRAYQEHICARAGLGPNEELQYGDYLAGLDEWLSGPTALGHLAYWRDRLGSAPPMLPQVASSSSMTEAVEWEPITVDAELTSALSALARQCKTTLFVVLLAAHKVVLSRLADNVDVTMGAVVGGREVPGLERVIGYMADRVYYRTDLAGNPTFKEIVQRVHAGVAACFRYQFIRSDTLREHLLAQGVPIVAPILNFVPLGRNESRVLPAEWQRFQISPPGILTGTSSGMRYWVDLRETSNGLYGRVKYGGPAIPGLVEGFQKVLRAAVEDCERRVGSFALQAGGPTQ